jgi:hypothetical protein
VFASAASVLRSVSGVFFRAETMFSGSETVLWAIDARVLQVADLLLDAEGICDRVSLF